MVQSHSLQLPSSIEILFIDSAPPKGGQQFQSSPTCQHSSTTLPNLSRFAFCVPSPTTSTRSAPGNPWNRATYRRVLVIASVGQPQPLDIATRRPPEHRTSNRQYSNHRRTGRTRRSQRTSQVASPRDNAQRSWTSRSCTWRWPLCEPGSLPAYRGQCPQRLHNVGCSHFHCGPGRGGM